jgi:3-methyladenine DNA glycosylase AlkD
MLESLKTILEAEANEAQAAAMSAYMKHRFSFLGIKKPQRASLTKDWIAAARTLPYSDTELLVHALWEAPEREYQYVALDLIMKLERKAPQRAIELYTHCVVEKSWWDTVDLIASNLIATHFKRFPEDKVRLVEDWRNSDNEWLVRCCLLFQLKYKQTTDVELLSSLIQQHAQWKTFFIEKAIGWALRQYAKEDPQWVIDFVERLPMSALSRREALKNV